MGLFHKRKQETQTITNTKPRIIMQDSNATIAAFEKNELATFLTFLQSITKLEVKTHKKSLELEREKREEGLSDFARTPEIKKLWEDYQKKYAQLATPICSANLLQRGYGESFGIPARFSYIDQDCRLSISMPNEQEIVMIADDCPALPQKDKFIFHLFDDSWLLDEVYFAYPNSEKWYCDHI